MPVFPCVNRGVSSSASSPESTRKLVCNGLLGQWRLAPERIGQDCRRLRQFDGRLGCLHWRLRKFRWDGAASVGAIEGSNDISGALFLRSFTSGLQNLVNGDFLDVPHGGGADIDGVGTAAIDRVDQVAGVLLTMVLTGHGHAEHFSGQIHLVDFARCAVASEEILGSSCW